MKRSVLTKLDKIDWDFRDFRQSWASTDLNFFHWHPASFIPQIPAILINALSKENDIVLDPFCGSGTTLVEAMRLNRRFVGVDINPLACMIAKSKAAAIRETTFVKLIEFLNKLQPKNSKSESFSDKDLRQRGIQLDALDWFHPTTFSQLIHIYDSIAVEPNEDLRLTLQVAFSNILIRCCSQRDHYGFVADNVKPKTGEFRYINAFELFENQLESMILGIKEFTEQCRRNRIISELVSLGCIRRQDARNLDFLPNESVDLVVTSPPYVNVTDSVKAQRLSFLFFPLGDMMQIKQAEIGARWKRARKSALKDYGMEVAECFREIHRVLKKGKAFCCVLGETRTSSRLFSPVEKLVECAQSDLHFKLIASYERLISGKRIQILLTRRGVSKERILIFEK